MLVTRMPRDSRMRRAKRRRCLSPGRKNTHTGYEDILVITIGSAGMEKFTELEGGYNSARV